MIWKKESNLKQFLFGRTGSFTPGRVSLVCGLAHSWYMCWLCVLFYFLHWIFVRLVVLICRIEQSNRTNQYKNGVLALSPVWAQWNIIVTLWKLIFIGHSFEFLLGPPNSVTLVLCIWLMLMSLLLWTWIIKFYATLRQIIIFFTESHRRRILRNESSKFIASVVAFVLRLPTNYDASIHTHTRTSIVFRKIYELKWMWHERASKNTEQCVISQRPTKRSLFV